MIKRSLTIALARNVTAAVGLVMALGLAMMPMASAATTVAYDNTPNPLPGNVVSQAFEATQTSEFGGQIKLDGTQRTNLQLKVVMSSWGCKSGTWNAGNCKTPDNATFSEPVTANVYKVNDDNSPGKLVGSVTQTFNIPYRPSASNKCTGNQAGEWYSTTDKSCYNGLATPITFNTSGLTWPNKAIVSLTYNTTHYGYHPYGEKTACYKASSGCGYDSLNVGLTAPADEANPKPVKPAVGSDPQPNNVYANAAASYGYCDGTGDTGVTGVFRETAACWTGYQPLLRVASVVNEPTSKDQCKNNGYKNYTDASGGAFTSQADCVTYVKAQNGGNASNSSSTVTVTNNNNVTVTNNNSQSSSTGSSNVSGNTNGGASASGGANNGNASGSSFTVGNNPTF